jgi:ribonucleotide reductase alpha subunit
LDTLTQKLDAKKAIITHVILDADTVYTQLVNNQIRSAKPYIMHGDAVNYKSNQKNMGATGSSNLCLEITERSTPDEMATCNLASLNLKHFVKGQVSWKAALVNYAELVGIYDFADLGSSTQSLVENLDQIIEKNYYPLDEHDDVTGEVITRGKISRPNFQHRPLGIGGSGLFDAYVETDQTYDSPGAELLNKMIFACIYWNALVKSLELAIRHGAYETFRAGGYNRYLGNGKWSHCQGSPLSNGQFQFDLWAEEAQLLNDNGDLIEEIYNREDDIPVNPILWGQNAIRIKCTSYNGEIVDITVEPSWDSLRSHIMKYGVRNSLLIALMPTATTAQIFSNAESTEAHQSVMYTRTVSHGNFTIVIPRMIRDLRDIGLWTENLTEFIKACGGTIKHIHHYIADNPEEFPAADFQRIGGRQVLNPEMADRLKYIQRKYQTMYEMSQKIPIRQSRQRGIYVCQSQSLNIYARDLTQNQLKAIHSYTNAMGLKTGMYYLRMDPATFTGKFTINPSMLQYVQKLMQKIGETTYLTASSIKEVLTDEAVCEMKPGCESCQ